MSKVLRDEELAAIIRNIVHRVNAIGTPSDYLDFVEDLGALIAKYCGGSVVTASCDMNDGLGHCVHFDWNHSVPDDGGVYACFDTDVSVAEWKDQALQDHPQIPLPVIAQSAVQ